MSALPLKADMAGVIGKFAKLRLCLWLGVFEGRHRLGVLIEPGHELGMSGTPFAFVPEIEIAEGTGKREIAVIGAAAPSWAGRARGRSWPAGAVARARATSHRGGIASHRPAAARRRGCRRPMSQGPAFSNVRVRSSGTAPVRASDYRDTRRLRCCRRSASCRRAQAREFFPTGWRC